MLKLKNNSSFFKVALLSVSFFFCLISSGQKSTISGYVRDGRSKESLIGAKIYVKTLNTGAITNTFGFYSLTLDNGDYEVLFSFVGKTPQKKAISLNENIELDIFLEDNNQLATVEVLSTKKEQETTEISTHDLSMSKVKSLPVLFGEHDIIKTAQLLPGIQSGSEGSSGIYVRGGGPDQNLILLDGVPIYNVNHLFGFFSVFNADAINNVKLIKGGFPAEYGGRISAVMDIQMNEGNYEKLHGEGSVGIISSKLMLNGPLGKKTSFMVCGRRTYLDLIAKPFINAQNKNKEDEKLTGGYFFYDVNGKINHTINSKNRIYLSTYLGDDKFKFGSEYKFEGQEGKVIENINGGLSWGNRIVALRWNHKFNGKLFANFTANYGNYKFRTGFDILEYSENDPTNPYEDFGINYLSGISDFGVKADFFYYPKPTHKIQWGVGEIYHTFKPGVNRLQLNGENGIDTTYGSRNIYAHEFHGYFQDDFKFNNRISANLGLHFSNFLVRQKWHQSLQPRAAINLRINDNAAIKFSYSKMTQFLHLLTNTSAGLPTDLWVPATDSIPPQQGHQFAIGYAQQLKKNFNLSIEGYYKSMNNVIEYEEGASFFGSEEWETLVEIGKGNSYGAEFLLEKKLGKTTGWIGYTLSWTNRHFEQINFGEVFPYRYDRRHDISFVLTHKFNDQVDVGVVWVYGTGNAITLGLQQYESMDENGEFVNVNHIEQRNNYRMPAYHRLDLGVNLHKKKKWGEAIWSFSIYNAYSRQNPFYVQFGFKKENAEDVKILEQVSLFPLIPSISYSFKF